jgi:hypothetical protein
MDWLARRLGFSIRLMEGDVVLLRKRC